VLWLLLLATGLRPPTSPITLSDTNSGGAARQLIFAGAAGLASAWLWLSRCVAPLLVTHWKDFAMAGFIMGSALWSTEPALTIKRSLIFLFAIITLTTLIQTQNKPLRSLLLLVVGFSSFLALVSILMWLLLPKVCSVNPARPGLAGVSNHPNTLAPFLSIGLLLSAGITASGTAHGLALGSARALLAVALLMTQSMTTLVTTLIGLALFFYLASRDYMRGLSKLMIMAGCLLVGLIGLDTLKNTFFATTGRDASLSGRDQLWGAVWNEAQKSIWIGNGYGAFWTEGKGRALVQTWNPRQAHHAYLDIITDLGVLGLLVIVAYIPWQLFVAWRSWQGPPGSPQRRATAAVTATALAYLLTYAVAQSYLLRFDSFPFFVLGWTLLVMTNPGSNRVPREFAT
jgi:O-antigen ligase